jgi:Tfp pilus assembly protein PilN
MILNIVHVLITNWKVAVTVLVGLALIALGVYVKVLKADIKVLETNNQVLSESLATATIAIDQMKAEQAKNLIDLVKRENELKSLAKENDEFKQHIEEVYKDDKEACDWGSDTVPNAVIKLLCEK